jgi:hypothetical protein
MRTTARDFLMDGNEGQPFRNVIDNLDEDIILDCMEEYADYKILNSAEKEIKTETLFDSLEIAKHNIAEKFSNKYFDDDNSFYWLGEVLSICDEFINLEDIKYSLENNIYESVLFKYLSKPRNFNLSDYCLGKLGRKEKRKQELVKINQRLELSKKYFQESLLNLVISTNKNKYGKEEDIY